MNVRGLMTMAIAVSAAGTLLAQTAQLSGTWVLDRDKTMARSSARGGGATMGGGGGTIGSGAVSSGGGGGGGGGARMGGGGTMSVGGGGALPEVVVTQTAAALTSERTLPNGSVQKFVFKLDGTESVNVNGNTTLKTKSHWDAGKLVTEGTQATKSDQGDISGTFKEVRSLEKDGTMVVETTRQFDANPPVTSTQVFAKKK